MSGLVEKLEAAEVGSRELDARIWCATNGITFKKMIVVRGFPDKHYSFRTSIGDVALHGPSERPPVAYVTTSLDAALDLAERVLPNKFTMHVVIGPSEASATIGVDATAWAATPALALCAAILRAKEAA